MIFLQFNFPQFSRKEFLKKTTARRNKFNERQHDVGWHPFDCLPSVGSTSRDRWQRDDQE